MQSRPSLDAYRLPLLPAPQRVLEAFRNGVRHVPIPSLLDAQRVLGGTAPPADGVFRARDGRVLVSCVTDLPGVTPAMVEWWFGWHLPATERYALWHPTAHVKAVVKEDRSSWPDARSRYLGNVSYVDEYIGPTLKKLAIAFVPPERFGLLGLARRRATAICARTSDRILRGEGGCLVHYVVPTPEGSQMRSGFWLGEIRHQVALVDRLLHPALNTRAARQLIVSDRMALDLLLHCAEEMNHLARFLPALHADMQAAESTLQRTGS